MHYLFLLCFAVSTTACNGKEDKAVFRIERELSRPEVVAMFRRPGRNFNDRLGGMDAIQRRIESNLSAKKRLHTRSAAVICANNLNAFLRPLLITAIEDRRELIRAYIKGKSVKEATVIHVNAYDPTFHTDTAQRIIVHFQQYAGISQEMRELMRYYNDLFLQDAKALDMAEMEEFEATLDLVKLVVESK
jgi:hypothetical protein